MVTLGEEAQNLPNIEQKDSIKIIKNTKGYNFEFRILSLDVELMDKIHNQIINKINEWETNDLNKKTEAN